MNQPIGKVLSCLFGLALLGGCASTEITSSWRDPSFSRPIQKVLVLAVARQEGPRRSFEAIFSNDLENWGVRAIPGFSVPLEANAPQETITAKARELGVDAILITKLVNLQKDRQQVTNIDTHYDTSPGYFSRRDGFGRTFPHYDNWYRDYSNSYTTVRSYDVEYKILDLETSLYDFASGRLVWTALTRTVTAAAPAKEVADIVQVLVKQLSDDGLI